MTKFKRITNIHNIGNVSIEVTTDTYSGRLLESTVGINSGILCEISGENVTSFISDFKELIQKYKIV